MRLAIVDLGYGNIGSVGMAFERLGLVPEVTGEAERIGSADRVVLPGVGHAGFAMRAIAARGMAELLRGLSQPLLGICLGMQLLFDESEEEATPGLGLIPGKVRRLVAAPGRPVPHMGWSRLSVRDPSIGLSDGDQLYFAHSFACPDGPATLATADHGGPIPAVVRAGNRTGVQFHPERSSVAGRKFLEAWLSQ